MQTENLARARAVGRTVFHRLEGSDCAALLRPEDHRVAGEEAAMGAPLDHSGLSVASADS